MNKLEAYAQKTKGKEIFDPTFDEEGEVSSGIYKFQTPVFRLMYPSLVNPSSFDQQKEPTYNIKLAFVNGTDLSVLHKANNYAIEEKFGPKAKYKGETPIGFKIPTTVTNQNVPGYTLVNAKNRFKPELREFLDGKAVLLDSTQADRFYSGCWCTAILVPWAYNHDLGGKGVSYSLLSIVKIAEGAPLVSAPKIDDSDFEGLEAPPEAVELISEEVW